MENSRVQPEVLNQAWLQLPPWQPLTLEARRDARRGKWLAGEMLSEHCGCLPSRLRRPRLFLRQRGQTHGLSREPLACSFQTTCEHVRIVR